MSFFKPFLKVFIYQNQFEISRHCIDISNEPNEEDVLHFQKSKNLVDERKTNKKFRLSKCYEIL